MTADTADRFWLAFREQATTLANQMARGELRAAFDRVEQLLEQNGFGFSFDMTETEANEPVLILTPEGDQDEARRIDELLARRPDIKGWRFFGRRQRKPLGDAFVFVRHVHGVDVSDATFDLRDNSGSYDVTMYSAGFRGMASEDARLPAATFLDHAVGESLVMSRVQSIETQPEGGGALSAAQLVTRLLGN